MQHGDVTRVEALLLKSQLQKAKCISRMENGTEEMLQGKGNCLKKPLGTCEIDLFQWSTLAVVCYARCYTINRAASSFKDSCRTFFYDKRQEEE